jgi:hypothetical protein
MKVFIIEDDKIVEANGNPLTGRPNEVRISGRKANIILRNYKDSPIDKTWFLDKEEVKEAQLLKLERKAQLAEKTRVRAIEDFIATKRKINAITKENRPKRVKVSEDAPPTFSAYDEQVLIAYDPDFTITKASLAPLSSFTACWESVSAGFGNITFYNKEGKFIMDTECMDKDFVKSVLCKLVDEATDDREI